MATVTDLISSFSDISFLSSTYDPSLSSFVIFRVKSPGGSRWLLIPISGEGMVNRCVER